MKNEKNFGLIAAIDWNSNKWKKLPTKKDLENSNFGYVKDKNMTFTGKNFGHDIYPIDNEGYFWGLLPQLWNRMPDKEKSAYIEIAFIRSQDWRDKNNYIIGFYAFPWFVKSVEPYPFLETNSKFWPNIKAFPKDIHLLKNPLKLNDNPDLVKYLPKDKELGKQGYNYLTKANVYKILDAMSKLNPKDKKLSGIKLRLITTIDKIK
jgi:5-methylcytosine-specific restriction protein A